MFKYIMGVFLHANNMYQNQFKMSTQKTKTTIQWL